MGQRVLTFAFLCPSREDHWVNRLTAAVSRHPFCHVELFFEGQNQCFSIIWGERAGFRAKSLSNPNYRVLSLYVSAREYDSCLQYCQSIASQGLVFDNGGMWCSWLPCQPCAGPSQSTGATFCSKVITEALQFGGLHEVGHLQPSAVTPSVLYTCIKASPRLVCNSVPFKRQSLLMFSSM